MEPIDSGQVIGPAGELVARERLPMPGIVPVPWLELAGPPIPDIEPVEELGGVSLMVGMVLSLPETPDVPVIAGMEVACCAAGSPDIDGIDPDGVAD
jgi:hypothetical protein